MYAFSKALVQNVCRMCAVLRTIQLVCTWSSSVLCHFVLACAQTQNVLMHRCCMHNEGATQLNIQVPTRAWEDAFCRRYRGGSASCSQLTATAPDAVPMEHPGMEDMSAEMGGDPEGPWKIMPLLQALEFARR